MAAKIKNGDDVVVLVGRDRGKIGKVIKVMTRGVSKRVVVAGVNVHSKHAKPKPGSPGSIIHKELPVDVSNVAILDPERRKPTRVGFKFEDGRKVRFAKVSGRVIDFSNEVVD